MNIVCEVCGHIGFKYLLTYCRECKDSAVHQYCLDEVIFDGSLADWCCEECQQKSGENQQVDNENPVHSLGDKAMELFCRHSNETPKSVPQHSTLQHDVTDKVMPCSPNTCILVKENSCLPPEHIENEYLQENQREPSNLPSEHTENENQKENQSESSNLFDRAYSCPSLETYPAKFLLEESTAEVEICADLGKDIPRKRRRLILSSDDDDEEVEGAAYVQLEKKRRRYIGANEDDDEEAAIDVATARSTQNDVANCAQNDGANLKLQTAAIVDHPLQSTIACNSDAADQQFYIYSRPVDEPVWSGVFKINNEVFGELDAHLSNKACQKVWDLSRMLEPEVDVTKLPRLQAWPKRWMSAAPTDDCIGLFFFPRSSRPNEVSHKLVNELIESNDALKVTIGVIELLIFPSTLLSEQNHLFQGKHYLWGVFKQRKDKPDRGGLVGEQDGSACATEESKLQEHLLDRQDGISCESSGQETSTVKDVVHVENELMVDHNSLAQKVVMKIAEREGITLPDSNLFYAKPNPPRAESNCSVHPRIDHALEMNQHEEYIHTPPVLNATSVTKPTNTGVTKPTTGCDLGQCNSGSEPLTMKLFGLVAVRTPRAQQLIQEMASEGALIFSVPEQIVTAESRTGSSVEVESCENRDTDNQHLREHPQSFDFISTSHDVPDVASKACLELFPVRQENIRWSPRAEATKEVDLDLSLGTRSRAPSVQL